MVVGPLVDQGWMWWGSVHLGGEEVAVGECASAVAVGEGLALGCVVEAAFAPWIKYLGCAA